MRFVTESGIRGFWIPNSQTQKMYIWYKQIKELKLNKKTKEKENKEKEVNNYKSTFSTINDIIFIAIICFDWREQLLYILLRSYFVIALTTLFWFGFLIYCDSTFPFHLLGFLSISFHNSTVSTCLEFVSLIFFL